WWWPVTDPTSSPSPSGASPPTRCWPGVSATTARCGRAGRTAGPTSAAATPASSPPPPSRTSAPSSPDVGSGPSEPLRRGGYGGVVSGADLDDCRADVLAGEHGVEGGGRGREALEGVAPVPEPARVEPPAEHLGDLGEAATVVPRDEPLHPGSPGDEVQVVRRAGRLVPLV